MVKVKLMSNTKHLHLLLIADQPASLAVLQALLTDFDAVLVCANSACGAL